MAYPLRKLIITVLLGAVFSALTACAPNAQAPAPASPAQPPAAEQEPAEQEPAKPEPPAGPTAAELAARITEQADMTNWRLAEPEALRRFYAWEEEPADAVLYLAATNIQADELMVVALADAEAARAVLPVLERRLADQEKNFAGYLPEQEFLLENAVCLSKGRYALLVVSAQAEEIRAAFEAGAE
ncbi:MAG: DUF4358 domain-containing protein [Gracilibacteraceae bacterium]|nr:DUF4358 domain-containing protein [Gracilibacteraceae bacterium]